MSGSHAATHISHYQLRFPPEQRQQLHAARYKLKEKLRRGEADWTTQKKMLGWIMDILQLAIYLPYSRLKRIEDVINWFPRSKCGTSAWIWHQLLGTLRIIMDAISRRRGLFCHLPAALRVHKGRDPLTQAVHNDLDDWRRLIASLHSRPAHILELVPLEPVTLGAHNDCSDSMGSVFQGNDGIPFVWR